MKKIIKNYKYIRLLINYYLFLREFNFSFGIFFIKYFIIIIFNHAHRQTNRQSDGYIKKSNLKKI